jgi:aspartyl-tRNA(Asn)/glutamyl-tRNA(Gln) amidotransferase subunit B
MTMQWETVIGLEIHVQLSTRSKIFSGASTRFGAEPNTQACAVDLAMPGTLPVLNEQAVHDAVMFGLAVNSEINRHSVFERKNYFYPDLPKGYQTSQLEQPIVGPGEVEILLQDGSSKRIRIHHAHLEEDAGKSLHRDFHGMSGIDLNRAGTPLIEIVTEPDMRSAAEAIAFARKMHAIVTSLGISDGAMAQGSMRFDVNISVRPLGTEKLGTRTETKNLNSFKFMEDAIRHEVARQIEIIEDGGTIAQETRLYNGDTGESRSMRSKEEANDYRYFPCPDLLPVHIEQDTIDRLRATLPELPDSRQARFASDYGLGSYDASLLAGEKVMADYYEATVAACRDAKLSANWIMADLTAALNRSNLRLEHCPVTATQLGKLICRIADGTISGKIAKQEVFPALWDKRGDVDQIIAEKGLQQVSDSGALEQLVDRVLADKARQVEQYQAADENKRKKLLGGFMGPIMQASGGQANPAMVTEILKRKLES